MKKLARLSSVSIGASLLLVGMHSACTPQEDAALADIDTNAPFIAIPKVTSAQTQALRQRALRIAGVVDQPASGDDFYLAINKKELGKDKQWFLSSYIKQFYPGGVSGGAARSAGTRVVSFKAQNGKLFVFDTDNRKVLSDVFNNPDTLVDAYPQVSYAPFDRLPGSSQFVLFDPGAGLNKFAVLGDEFAGGTTPAHFEVSLSYLNSYRSLSDGITFEKIFTGNLTDANRGDDVVDPNAFRFSGTLGIGLRRYSETTGYAPTEVTQIDGQDLYFRGDPIIIPNTGFYTQTSIKWALDGKRQIEWVVSDVVDKIQADPRFKAYDIYGAIAKGVTNWNAVIGYEALKVRKGTADDNAAQADKNYIYVDPDTSFGAAFANWRNNPNTGEILGASVYFNAIWVESADSEFSDDPKMLTAPKLELPKALPRLVWGPTYDPKSDLCLKWAPVYKGARPMDEAGLPIVHGSPLPGVIEATKKEKVEAYITHTVLHEIGHTLGLRHNFKGSLKFDDAKKVYSSSVMDYIVDGDAISMDKPQSYDIDAVKLLYGISKTAPTDKFCNDSGTGFDPDCATFDRTDSPLTKIYQPNYKGYLTDYLDGKSPVSPNNSLNYALDWAKQGDTAAIRAGALDFVWNQKGYSLLNKQVDATKLKTIAGYGQRVDFLANRLLRRLFIDDASVQGRFPGQPADSAIVKLIYDQAKLWIKNDDGIRSATTRRSIATWLKTLQTVDAYNALATGGAELDAEITAGTITDPAELVRAQDTLKYIDQLLNPYFTSN